MPDCDFANSTCMGLPIIGTAAPEERTGFVGARPPGNAGILPAWSVGAVVKGGSGVP